MSTGGAFGSGGGCGGAGWMTTCPFLSFTARMYGVRRTGGGQMGGGGCCGTGPDGYPGGRGLDVIVGIQASDWSATAKEDSVATTRAVLFAFLGLRRGTHTLSGRGAGGYSEREDDGPVFVAPREGLVTDARPPRVQIAARERAVAVDTLHITPYVDQTRCARLLKEPLLIRKLGSDIVQIDNEPLFLIAFVDSSLRLSVSTYP
jgi:hypothetical protein